MDKYVWKKTIYIILTWLSLVAILIIFHVINFSPAEFVGWLATILLGALTMVGACAFTAIQLVMIGNHIFDKRMNS